MVILLDSITRLARAYNTVAPPSAKVLSGDLDSNALQKQKRFFGGKKDCCTPRKTSIASVSGARCSTRCRRSKRWNCAEFLAAMQKMG